MLVCVCMCVCTCMYLCLFPCTRVYLCVPCSLWRGRDPSNLSHTCCRCLPLCGRGRCTCHSQGHSSLRCDHRCMLGGEQITVNQSQLSQPNSGLTDMLPSLFDYLCSRWHGNYSSHVYSGHTYLQPRPPHTGTAPPHHMTQKEILIGCSHKPDSPAHSAAQKTLTEKTNKKIDKLNK